MKNKGGVYKVNKEKFKGENWKDNLFGPDPAQKKYWFLIWLIVFLPLVGIGVTIIIFSILGGIGFLIPFMVVMFFILYWYPLYHQSLHYSITDERVIVEKGVWWQRKTAVPLQMVTNVDRTQNPLERIYSIGKIHVQTAGAGGNQGARAEAVVTGIKNLSEVQENIERRIKKKIATKEPSGGKKEDIFEKILDEIRAIREELRK